MHKITKSILATSVLAGLLAIGMTATGNPKLARLQVSADAGDPAAMRHLAELYLDGHEVPRNVDLGIHWLTAITETPDMPPAEQLRAHYRLALHYEQQPQTPNNQERMVKHYRRAAELGHTTAQTRIGDLLMERAEDVAFSADERAKTRDQALRLYQHAAKAKNAYALWRMSQLVAEGRYLPKDPQKSLSYARQASEAGSIAASKHVANYYLGDPGADSYNEARGLYYLKRAAALKDPAANLAMAQRRMEGQGLPKDLVAAEAHARLAASAGFVPARELIVKIESMKADQAREDKEAALLAQSNAREEEKLKLERESAAAQIARLESEKEEIRRERERLTGETPSLPALADIPRPSPAPDTTAEARTDDQPLGADGDGALALMGSDPVVARMNERLNALDARLGEVEEESKALRAQLAERDARIQTLTAERDAALAALSNAEQVMTNAIAAIRSGRDVSSIAAAAPISSPAAVIATAAPGPKPIPRPSAPDTEDINRQGLIAARAGRFDVAIDYFKKAAAQHHGGALNNLGMLTMRGQGTRANIPAAIRYFEQAADAGAAAAANNLAYMYRHGVGVEPSRDQAIRWYQKGATLGSAEAQRELVAMGVMPAGKSVAAN